MTFLVAKQGSVVVMSATVAITINGDVIEMVVGETLRCGCQAPSDKGDIDDEAWIGGKQLSIAIPHSCT